MSEATDCCSRYIVAFSHLLSYCFSPYLQPVAIGEGKNIDRPLNLQLCCTLSSYFQSTPVQCLHHCRWTSAFPGMCLLTLFQVRTVLSDLGCAKFHSCCSAGNCPSLRWRSLLIWEKTNPKRNCFSFTWSFTVLFINQGEFCLFVAHLFSSVCALLGCHREHGLAYFSRTEDFSSQSSWSSVCGDYTEK